MAEIVRGLIDAELEVTQSCAKTGAQLSESDPNQSGKVVFVCMYRRGRLTDDTIVFRIAHVFMYSVRMKFVSDRNVVTPTQRTIILQIGTYFGKDF